jgi:hypothetical protein
MTKETRNVFKIQCDAVEFSRKVAPFPRNLLPPSSGWVLLPWRFKQQVLPKRCTLLSKIHGVRSQRRGILIFTYLKASNLTRTIAVMVVINSNEIRAVYHPNTSTEDCCFMLSFKRTLKRLHRSLPLCTAKFNITGFHVLFLKLRYLETYWDVLDERIVEAKNIWQNTLHRLLSLRVSLPAKIMTELD